MITVDIDNSFGSYKATIEGHAGYDDCGVDIVCSAVSILAYTLAETANRMHIEGKMCDPPAIVMDVGMSSITCFPDNRYTEEMDYAFRFFLTGIELLAQSYPENVRLKD